ncbi:hypothetical protein MTO96_010579 [Rhipicephalus appendiculatus]
MLSLLRTQAAGLAVDPLSALIRRNPELTSEGSALLEPALRSSRSRLHHPLSEMAHADHAGYASRFDILGRRSPSTSERTGTRSLPAIRSPCSGSGQQHSNADNSTLMSDSDSATSSTGTLRHRAHSSVDPYDIHADKSSRSLLTAVTAQSKRSSQSSSDSSDSSDTDETFTRSAAHSTNYRWQVDTVHGHGRVLGSRSPSKRHARTPPMTVLNLIPT